MSETVALPELAGRSGTLYFTLNNVADANADVLIGNMAFIKTSALTVPEPSTLVLCGLSIAILWFGNQQREQRMHRSRRRVFTDTAEGQRKI